MGPMKIEDLSLISIDGQTHLTTSEEIVRAVAWAARRGWGNYTAHRFVTALVMTDNLRHTNRWPEVMKKIDDLKVAADLAALEVHGHVEGEIEGS